MLLDGLDPAAIRQAAQALAAGALLGLPTETVYGLAADASSDAAVAKIFTAKGRPSDHPLIVHIAPGGGGGMGVAHFAADVPAFAQVLMDAFWPGPLTLILPRRAGVGAAAAGGQDSIGLRCPAHPVAQAVLQACAALGVAGLAAPSANQFGRVSPTTAAHVQSEFGADLLVLDGGPCTMGIESTIVDCTRGAPVLLRPGSIGRDQIEQACGQPLRDKDDVANAPRASGTLEAHYAPTAKVRLMTAAALQTALDLLGTGLDGQAVTIAVYARHPMRSRSAQVVCHPMPPLPPRPCLPHCATSMPRACA
jgi:L-threonylcarbamoyladenylate synthase